MQVKMLSILIDPRPERRNELLADLVRFQIDFHYLNITTDSGYTTVKGLVPNSEEALASLQEAGYTAFVKDILAVGIVQGYDNLARVLHTLDALNIQAEQCSWVFSPAVGPFLLMVVKDLAGAQAALHQAGYNILDEGTLCR